jgi:hypothetical protein
MIVVTIGWNYSSMGVRFASSIGGERILLTLTNSPLCVVSSSTSPVS